MPCSRPQPTGVEDGLPGFGAMGYVCHVTAAVLQDPCCCRLRAAGPPPPVSWPRRPSGSPPAQNSRLRPAGAAARLAACQLPRHSVRSRSGGMLKYSLGSPFRVLSPVRPFVRHIPGKIALAGALRATATLGACSTAVSAARPELRSHSPACVQSDWHSIVPMMHLVPTIFLLAWVVWACGGRGLLPQGRCGQHLPPHCGRRDNLKGLCMCPLVSLHVDNM